jgi:hypothetical protein
MDAREGTTPGRKRSILASSALGHADDVRLPALGLALTNLCPRPTRSAAELARAERARGRRAARG